MTIVGLDDTDSRTRGMCTTYVAAMIASDLEHHHSVTRLCLIRLNPAIQYKTRGNAAIAIHTDCEPNRAFEIARDRIDALAATEDERTNPGLVVTDHVAPDFEVPESVAEFSRRALRDHLQIDEAIALIEECGYKSWSDGDGRGRIGALAAIGSWRHHTDWTVEEITYRKRDRWGSPRDVDEASVFEAADWGYPTVWDTVDRDENETVCIPHTPGPILYGIRGDEVSAVKSVGRRIESEPIARRQLFVTNQGTDAHLRDGRVETIIDGRGYTLHGTIITEPNTRRGGHVFFELDDSTGRIDCVAFEPTKRFRDHVRKLHTGDRVTVCGELDNGTLKLEKIAIRDLVQTERVTPTCTECDRRMESAGRSQGYRCRQCGTTAPDKAIVTIDRDLEVGWYEVPPCARRHIAKPLIRGGFDAPTHPER